MKNPLDKSILDGGGGSLRHAEAARAFVEKHPLIVEWLPKGPLNLLRQQYSAAIKVKA